MYRILSFYVKSKFFLTLFILIFLSTVLIKIHYIFGAISGFILAEIIYRFVFKNLERKQAFLNIKSAHALIFYVCFFSILGYIYYLMTS